jgi:hypothetical protein
MQGVGAAQNRGHSKGAFGRAPDVAVVAPSVAVVVERILWAS